MITFKFCIVFTVQENLTFYISRVIQKVLSFIQICDLSHTYRLCIGLTSKEIKTDI